MPVDITVIPSPLTGEGQGGGEVEIATTTMRAAPAVLAGR